MRKNILRRILVRAPNWIGDAVMCEPAIRGLRALFPQAELTLLAKSSVAELFIGYAGLDRVLVYEDKGLHAGLSGKWVLSGLLRKHHFDCAVLFQNAFEAAFLAWLAGIPYRYGYATDGRVFFLTDPVAPPDRGVSKHQVEYYWNVLRPLGAVGAPSAPKLAASTDEVKQFDARLESAGIAPDHVVIGVNPGSTYGGAKRWLPDRFAEVADRLAEHMTREGAKHVAVVILGAPGEESLGKDIAGRMKALTLVLSGATTIRELLAATQRCRLFLTNDTGPMHIAAACGVPVVAVFGPTDWRTTAAYGQDESVVREPVDCSPCLLRECPIDHRCMTRVSSERVYEVATKVSKVEQLERNKPEGEVTFAPSNFHTPLAGYTVFLDRDGTLNPDPGYIRSEEQFELFPGVSEALGRLKQAGARLIVVTNQSGIARGLLSLEDLDAIHLKLKRLLSEAGASLDAIYFCPHHPDEGCRCRKPNTGMIDQVLRDWNTDLAHSYLIGDQGRDVELAKRIGARSILVGIGHTMTEHPVDMPSSEQQPDWTAASLDEAADWILRDAEKRSLYSNECQRIGS